MPGHEPSPPDEPRTTRFAWFVGPAFVGLAAWFGLLAPRSDIPVSGTPAFDRSLLSVSIRPTVDEDPPMTRVGAYEYRCSDCHRLFRNEVDRSKGLVQHTGIVFDHGMNDRCLNCHAPLDRDKLLARDGSYLSYTQIPELCAQCHGPTTRDWQRGIHGKTLGSWETGSAEQRRLRCTECHDPHMPAFPAYSPLPGPHTPRMGRRVPEPDGGLVGPLALPFGNGPGTPGAGGAAR